jgi:hypothetical protein
VKPRRNEKLSAYHARTRRAYWTLLGIGAAAYALWALAVAAELVRL